MSHRKRSGHGSGNTSMTDVRRAAVAMDSSKHKRPAALTRRLTPQSTHKLGRSPKDRERYLYEGWDDDDDRGESFPQYCMACEKQFLPHDERIVYCSETCRKSDTMTDSLSSRRAYAYSGNYQPYYSASHHEPRDIIPRASPSRPTSTHLSPPTTPGAAGSYHYTSAAISALRSLTIGPSSPHSPSSNPSHWTVGRSAATSPGTSYVRGGSGLFSTTYDSGYGNGVGYGYDLVSGGADRPLPSRRPGTHSRPKSIELVTPMVGR